MTAHLGARWWVEIGDQRPNMEQILFPEHHSPTLGVFSVLLFLVNSSWKVTKQACVCVCVCVLRAGTKGKAFQEGVQPMPSQCWC